MRISDWSSDVCSSDLDGPARLPPPAAGNQPAAGLRGDAPPGAEADRDRDARRPHLAAGAGQAGALPEHHPAPGKQSEVRRGGKARINTWNAPMPPTS